MYTKFIRLWADARGYFMRQSLVKKVALGAGGLLALSFLGALLFVFFVWAGLFGSLPSKDDLRTIQHQVATEVYSADSVLLGRYYIQERSTVKYKDISPALIDALIATEDVRFYEHHGIDVHSLFRVLIKTIILRNESAGGGSTLTQQLVKNLYPRKKYWLLSLPINKVREAITAYRLENIYNKEEILTLYLNTVPFGDGAYGIGAAAERFFSKTPKGVTVQEAAVLIGMLKATYYYNPRIFPDRSKSRRNVVLAQMEKYNKLSPVQVDSLQMLPLEVRYKKITHHSGVAPYFRSYIKKDLVEWCRSHKKENGDPYNIYADGLKVYTTINSKLQTYAEQAVKSQMKDIQAQFDRHWKNSEPWKHNPQILMNAVHQSERYASLKEQGLSEEEIMEEMKKPVVMNIFTWEGEKEVKMSPLDSVKHHLKFLNAGLLAMDPTSGAVKAWVGGIDHHYFQYDHVKETTKRQVGSTFKPIVFAAALEKGLDPCDYISAERVVFTDMENWSPENSGHDNYDQKYSMEGALAYSVNTASVRLLEMTGIPNTIRLAKEMGINSDIPSVPSLALGVSSISMMEMVTAYSSFANGGQSVKPFYISTITDRNGNVLEDFREDAQDEAKQVLKEENAMMIVHMLKRVINEGTGTRLRSKYGINNEVAGKTGTTQSNADGWFMALTPQLVVGTWVGADDPGIRFRTTALGQGSNTALPIFARLMQFVNRDASLRYISKATFPPLSERLQRKMDCALQKEDKTFFERIFGKKEKQVERGFGEKQGFFQKLFRRKKEKVN